MVPHDLAPWDTAYCWFGDRTADGTWARIHEVLRDRVRVGDGRDPRPSAAILDSQSGKSVRDTRQQMLSGTTATDIRAVRRLVTTPPPCSGP